MAENLKEASDNLEINAQEITPKAAKPKPVSNKTIVPPPVVNKPIATGEIDELDLCVASSPHIHDDASTRRVMLDVLAAMLPMIIVSMVFFQAYALKQIVISVAACMVIERLCNALRKRPSTLTDLSAMVTGIVLALSMPATAPWYVTVIAAFAAIGLGKAVFGGLGMNIFNPAMVGRAFVMIAFAGAMAATGYVDPASSVDVITQATPLTAFKQDAQSINLFALFIGNANGSLGETSALAAIIGAAYLLIRRVITWGIPVAVLAAVVIISLLNALLTSNPAVSLFSTAHWSVLHQVFGGAVLFGAFFIATDPVTSPITVKGKLIFGFGVGFFIMLLRIFSGYPEGVMFAVLIMNAVTPLINRWTIPTPFGGFLQEEKEAE